MSVLDMKGNVMEELPMKSVFSDPNQPAFCHGDFVEVNIRGKRSVRGQIWWRSYGNEPSGIVPQYGVIPAGCLSARNSITASQDTVRLISGGSHAK